MMSEDGAHIRYSGVSKSNIGFKAAALNESQTQQIVDKCFSEERNQGESDALACTFVVCGTAGWRRASGSSFGPNSRVADWDLRNRR